jgi:hypothetical protein
MAMEAMRRPMQIATQPLPELFCMQMQDITPRQKRDSFLTIIGLRAVSEAALMFPDVFFYMLTGCKSLKLTKVSQQRSG